MKPEKQDLQNPSSPKNAAGNIQPSVPVTSHVEHSGIYENESVDFARLKDLSS